MSDPFPVTSIVTHEVKKGTHHLFKHGTEIFPGILGIMYLGSQERLTYLVPFVYSSGGHPDIYTEAGHIRSPNILAQEGFN